MAKGLHLVFRSLAVCLLLSILPSSGCKNSTTRTIAFIPQITADDLWESAHMGALDAARRTGFHVYWNGPTTEDDIRTQIALLDRVIDENDNGIILAPDQSLALMMPVQRAVSKGIPTVIVGSPLPLRASNNLAYVLNDEKEEGRIGAARIGQHLRGKGSVAILGMNPDIAGLVLRMHSTEAAFAQEFPGVNIVARRMGRYGVAQAEQTTRDVLDSNPGLGAILTLTHTATEGAYQALQETGRGDKVMLVGCGQQDDLLLYLSQGKIDSIIAENSYEMGFRAVQMIAGKWRGHSLQGTTYVEPVLITRENMYSPKFTPILTHDERNLR